jgi:hypothetical protein
MDAKDRLFAGLLMMALNPITALIVIPLLLLMAGVLVLGWLFIKSVEITERLIRRQFKPAPVAADPGDTS